MRNPIRNILTPQEQNVFLCFCALLLLGAGLQLFGWTPARELQEEQALAELQSSLAEAETLRIDIRVASKEELMILRGIGPGRAEAILEYRNNNPFSSVNQLMNVRGIGLKTYQSMLPSLVVFGDSLPLLEHSTRRSSASGTRRTSSPPAEDTTSIINLNTANLEQLCSLSGIGEVKARAIIAYREEHGPFASIEQIMEVRGIGTGLFERNRARLSVGN